MVVFEIEAGRRTADFDGRTGAALDLEVEDAGFDFAGFTGDTVGFTSACCEVVIVLVVVEVEAGGRTADFDGRTGAALDLEVEDAGSDFAGFAGDTVGFTSACCEVVIFLVVVEVEAGGRTTVVDFNGTTGIPPADCLKIGHDLSIFWISLSRSNNLLFKKNACHVARTLNKL
uniref:Uncharacterized protein n=1 Tax=Panagrolaimus sp. ES5 TaxID=591445 RepID=A0AC34FLP4_9BILA